MHAPLLVGEISVATGRRQCGIQIPVAAERTIGAATDYLMQIDFVLELASRWRAVAVGRSRSALLK